MIFKRKSFHIFKGVETLLKSEIIEIENYIKKLVPLTKGINVLFRIVKSEQTSCTRGEYCILIYSENKDYYLHNAGYLGEQLDLWLASKNIGVCWYGAGKVTEPCYNRLNFVIMLAISKSCENNFRKDYTKAKRKGLDEICNQDSFTDIISVAKFAPSACNIQPWYIHSTQNQIYLYRVKGKRGIMPQNKVSYYNKIDMGIMMFFLETCLKYENYKYKRQLFLDLYSENTKYLTAIYNFDI